MKLQHAAAFAVLLAGCASQPSDPAAIAEWKTCADGYLVLGYTLSAAGPDAEIAKALGGAIREECGTGGIDVETRAAHIYKSMLAIADDFGSFVRDYEARTAKTDP